MFSYIREYDECLENLGAPPTADLCITDPYTMTLSLDEKKLYLLDPEEYLECIDGARLEPEAYFCQQKYDYRLYTEWYYDDDYNEIDPVEELKTCFEEYYMPLSPKLDCLFKFGPDLNKNIQVK